jgi:hypothetical protein
VEPNKNFAIQSANPFFAGGIIRGASGQLADMFAYFAFRSVAILVNLRLKK